MKNIHILSTDKPSRLFKLSGDLYLHEECGIDPKRNQHIYITNDEEIQVNDYITDGYLIWKWKDDSSLLGRKKIILTTDQSLDGVQAIDDEFLNWFVKNSSCEFVEVITEQYTQNYHKDIWYNRYKIIIPQKKPKPVLGVDFEFIIDDVGMSAEVPIIKQETLEEAAMNWDYLSFEAGAKWQQERSYSEEEVKEIFYAGFYYAEDTSGNIPNFKQYFEQFKKK